METGDNRFSVTTAAAADVNRAFPPRTPAGWEATLRETPVRFFDAASTPPLTHTHTHTHTTKSEFILVTKLWMQLLFNSLPCLAFINPVHMLPFSPSVFLFPCPRRPTHFARCCVLAPCLCALLLGSKCHNRCCSCCTGWVCTNASMQASTLLQNMNTPALII